MKLFHHGLGASQHPVVTVERTFSLSIQNFIDVIHSHPVHFFMLCIDQCVCVRARVCMCLSLVIENVTTCGCFSSLVTCAAIRILYATAVNIILISDMSIYASATWAVLLANVKVHYTVGEEKIVTNTSSVAVKFIAKNVPGIYLMLTCHQKAFFIGVDSHYCKRQPSRERDAPMGEK